MKAKISIHKNVVLIGVILALIFLCIAMLKYPGGSLKNIHSTSYSLTQNYISNLMDYKAVNGRNNDSRPWGITGVVIMGITTGLAFTRFSRKITSTHYRIVITILAYLLILINTLITLPPLHNLMVTLGSILTLLLFFYVTIFFLKSRLKFYKIFSVSILLLFYGAAFMYFTRTALDFLPSVQKIIHLVQIVFILSLDYSITSEKLKPAKN